MEVTLTHVHRMTGKMECGCSAVAEFTDPACKVSAGPIGFAPCPTHAANEAALPILRMVLVEMVQKEARDRKEPAVESVIQRPHRREDAPGSAETVAEGPVTRSPIVTASRTSVGRAGIARPGGSTPGQHRVARPASSAGRLPKTAGVQRTAAMALDIDEVPEDPRITKLVEDFDFLSLGEVDES